MNQNYGLEKNDIFLTNMRHGLEKQGLDKHGLGKHGIDIILIFCRNPHPVPVPCSSTD